MDYFGLYLHRYGFNGKESDNEVSGTGNQYDYGFRIYNPRIGKFLSVDPLQAKYPGLCPYTFVANNLLNNIEVDGRYFVGIFGQRTKVRQSKNGKIRVGLFAKRDVRKMARRVNQSGSATAKSQFLGAAKNPTKIHFKIIEKEVNNDFYGMHQPHDISGKLLEYEGDGLDGSFNGIPAYIEDENGDIYYKEASIKIYQGNIEEDIEPLRNYHFDPNLTTNEETVSTFGHEIEHNIDQDTIKELKKRSDGEPGTFDVEEPAEDVEMDIREEIRSNRESN